MYMKEMRKKSLLKPRYFSAFAHALCTIYILSRILISQAQTSIHATTDPSEVTALNSIFRQWGIHASANWNISGEPCSGFAINDSISFDSADFNPAIKCDCSYNNGTTCHITQFRVFHLVEAVQGIIPEKKIIMRKRLWHGSGGGSWDLKENDFTGHLPPFIGNLTQLLYLDVGHNTLFGELPKELGNLINLISLGVGSNDFTGPLPPELGNLANLEQLYLDSSGVSGDIPSTFAKLQNLKVMRISELSNESSSLAFIKDMKVLEVLVLRNNNINDTIPSNIEEYQSLKQLNLIANNFNISGSNISGLPSGLNCLQRNFPCHRGSPIYYNFSINCGGPEFKSSAGIVFERENETLGAASYFVADTERWAVSNIGRFSENNNSEYTTFSPSSLADTLDSELYETARISPGSLRYYGLGLENGIYNVSLKFSETAFLNNRSWDGRGRRVFDIYIQSKLWLKDFDIKKKADGVSFVPVKTEIQAQVPENFLEIHLFWAGKGTCCIPSEGTYGPSISAISAVANFVPTISNTRGALTSTRKTRTGIIVGITVPVGVVCVLFVLLVYYILQRRKVLKIDEDEEFLGIASRPNTFSYAELRIATENFSPANKLGEGGFGPVYKGMLPDGRVVAVKQLSVASHHGKRQFIAEITTISAVQHRNLVKLNGCCIEGERRLLVYEYLENKSLDQALFGMNGSHLNWSMRYDICLGAARGLAYLHEDSKPRIVHRDVKASNILLDVDFIPKISDFGLAKLYDDNKTHISTRIAGTIGYLAPEYAMRGHLTEKADVFGFGVVALEIFSGRPNYSNTSLNGEKMYLLEWAWNLHESNHELELVDPSLSEYNDMEAKRLIGVALLCTQATPSLRPAMSRVVAMLSGDIEVSTVTSKPGYLTDWELDLNSIMEGDTSGASTSGNQRGTINSSNPIRVVDAVPGTPDQLMSNEHFVDGG
ncbi:hypothetical protein NE237_031101 [Protea cynaroides]|uniref:non-specific serine/threonine protein kinase n=1 Tax=Protea cynaroides TaxID=273540 RepID=A0A9Q0R253_9MAGN|nr:hypothetical protein NE237_031101 [Protea cynaroides]